MKAPVILTEFGEMHSSKLSLIILHGGPSIPFYTHALSQKLGENFHVIDYVQRSKEHTKALPPYTMQAHREDLLELIQEKVSDESRKTILIGHSWGALLALNFLSHFPEPSILGCLLICPAPLEQESREEFSKAIEARLSMDQASKREEILQKVKSLKKGISSNQLWTQYWKIIVSAYFFETSLALNYAWPVWDYECFDATLRSASEEHRKRSFLKEIKIPLQVISAEEDPIPSALVFKWILKNFPQAELSMLERCGHFPWLENEETQERFYELLAKHLDLIIHKSGLGPRTTLQQKQSHTTKNSKNN